MRFIVLTDNLTDGAKGTYVDIDDDRRARALVEAGAVEPAGGAPAKSAPKDDWVAFAVSSGADPDEAEASTKAELVETYGKDD